jgi:HEAT repeat protein
MNCQEINFLLDANSPEEHSISQKRAIDQHVESCQACREAWAAYREVSAIQIPQTPESLHSRIMAGVAPTDAQAIRRTLIFGGMLAVGAAVAATVALRLGDGSPEIAERLEEPTPVVAPAIPAGQEPAPAYANRVEADVSTENPNKPSDSTSSRTGPALDPNTIVIVPVPHPELDPRRAALFVQFHKEILRGLRKVPGLNVVLPELVEPFLRSGIPAEEVARDLGAGHVVVLSTTAEPSPSLAIRPVDMVTGAGGSMGVLPPFDSRWPVELPAQVAHAVDFIKQRLTTSTPAQRQAAIADARAIVLNAALPATERVKALGKLPQTEARTDAVVAAAVELATIAPELRAFIWRAMEGVENPYLIEPLLDSLAYDNADHRRRAAAAALRTFTAEPRVKAALENAQASDPSDTVREAAQHALLSEEELDQLALQKLFDEKLSAEERLAATLRLSGRYVRDVPLTDEAAWAVFDIGAWSADPYIREMAWGILGRSRVDDPSFKGVLLDDLAKHPSDSVRWMAANALRQFTDDSAVRAALELAESDSSFDVRRAARRALGKVPR